MHHIHWNGHWKQFKKPAKQQKHIIEECWEQLRMREYSWSSHGEGLLLRQWRGEARVATSYIKEGWIIEGDWAEVEELKRRDCVAIELSLWMRGGNEKLVFLNVFV